MSEGRRLRVFLNDGSGAGRVSGDELREQFARLGCQCVITPLDQASDWQALAREDGDDVVWVAAGGDGTVNTIAAAVIGSERVMGVLPLGTLNHFAKDLGIPGKLEDAIGVLARGGVRSVDAAEGAGIAFVNNSSIGAYPAMVQDRERMKKHGLNKWASLVAASAKAFWRFRCLEVELEGDAGVRRCRTPIVFVGNNRYTLDGGQVGQRERLDAGRIWVVLLPGATRRGMLRVLFAALRGRTRELGELEELAAERFSVHAKGAKRLTVAFDGEVRKIRQPVVYRALPGALRVIVPEPESP